MMIPSTMILTICIYMVLKSNRGLSLDIGSRYETAEHKTHNSNRMLVLLDRDWGGSKPTPQTKFQSPAVWGSSSTSGRLTPPPNPLTNRTLVF